MQYKNYLCESIEPWLNSWICFHHCHHLIQIMRSSTYQRDIAILLALLHRIESHRTMTQCMESIFLEPQCSKVRCFEQFSIIFRAVDMKYPTIFLACLAIVGSVWGMPQGEGSDPCTPHPCGDNSLCKANGNAGAIACYCQPGEFTKTDYQFQL